MIIVGNSFILGDLFQFGKRVKSMEKYLGDDEKDKLNDRDFNQDSFEGFHSFLLLYRNFYSIIGANRNIYSTLYWETLFLHFELSFETES